MRIALIFVVLTILFSGCDNGETITGGLQEQYFEKRAYEYSTSHYFVDVSYRDLFRDYYDNPIPQVDFTKRITDIDVWVTRVGFEIPEERTVIAYMELAAVREGEWYPDTLRQATTVPGQVQLSQFIRLDRSQYNLHPETGYITLNIDVRNEQAIAVAVRQENDPSTPLDDLFLGEFVEGDTSSGRIVLKLVKPPFLVPPLKPAWDLVLKNIYDLGGKDIKQEGFDLKILYEMPGLEPQESVENQNLLQVFGLDRYDESGGGGPDGRFDFIPGVTIDPERGELIFPVLEPFDEGIRQFFTALGLNADTLAYPAVYDTTVSAAQNDTQRDRYVIKGKYMVE